MRVLMMANSTKIQPEIPTTTTDLGNVPGQLNQVVQLPTIKNPLEDPGSPYFLHHGDNPGSALVSQPLTGQDNYVS
uniref:Uncharacterized protein n=1 Tax=Cannabis sativa TaxID=3483 RepID=A0A803PKD4_CANSA